MTEADTGDYPFDEAAVNAHVRDRERPVCGGFTSIEWNQHGNQEIAFACTHGPVDGCGWRVLITTTDQPFGQLVIWEVDHADQLHHEHAWRRLGQRADGTDS